MAVLYTVYKERFWNGSRDINSINSLYQSNSNLIATITVTPLF